MKKIDIRSYNDIKMEIIRLEIIMEQQQADIKVSMKRAYERSHPLTITAQLLTGSFKDVKNDNWVKIFNLIMYAYKKYVDAKERGVDNPIIDTIVNIFGSVHNANENSSVTNTGES